MMDEASPVSIDGPWIASDLVQHYICLVDSAFGELWNFQSGVYIIQNVS